MYIKKLFTKTGKSDVKRREEVFFPTISFIVPVFNKEDEIVKCIERLFNYASNYPGFVEIFVIDNGSKDNTYEVAYATMEMRKRTFPRVRTKLIRLSQKLEIQEILKICLKAALGQKRVIVKCEKSGITAEMLNYS